MTTRSPAPLDALVRHFVDLRDGTHGEVVSREDKEAVFAESVALLDPFARQVLWEVDEHLLLGVGTVAASGVKPMRDGGVISSWTLSWPEQRAARIDPVAVHAFYGAGFHHPHLRGSTLGEWPLNVFDAEQAAAELPTLRAIVSADLHNLVFQRDFRLVPAITGRVRP
ncbi:hypothetical protein [Umezawaea sp. Da 62-37]|uniref:hypothetical protein n=1 Tax=Umezawaea sp. Da 62-37 TaxID=3075927 RepID=UPI0028F6FC8F|nr:hypothetical protein [Umezawaea sp. Da 62-37]WNV84620.1 hypothetical protein RM788_41710 [Umezawaea sp. Da 62-37]